MTEEKKINLDLFYIFLRPIVKGSDVSKALGISRQSQSVWVNTEKIKAYKCCGCNYYKTNELIDMLDNRSLLHSKVEAIKTYIDNANCETRRLINSDHIDIFGIQKITGFSIFKLKVLVEKGHIKKTNLPGFTTVDKTYFRTRDVIQSFLNNTELLLNEMSLTNEKKQFRYVRHGEVENRKLKLMAKEVWTIDEAASIFNLSKNKIEKLIENKNVSCYIFCRKKFFIKEEFLSELIYVNKGLLSRIQHVSYLDVIASKNDDIYNYGFINGIFNIEQAIEYLGGYDSCKCFIEEIYKGDMSDDVYFTEDEIVDLLITNSNKIPGETVEDFIYVKIDVATEKLKVNKNSLIKDLNDNGIEVSNGIVDSGKLSKFILNKNV